MDLLFNNYMKSSGNGPTWHVDISPAARNVGSYFEETVKTLEYIYNNIDENIYVLYSGGMDSEYVCETLSYLKISYTPVIIDLGHSYNAHDIKFAKEFCERKNIKPFIIDIDYEEFVRSGELLEMATKVNCCSFRMPATMKAILSVDGFVLTGHDPPYMRNNNGRWQLEEEETSHSILNFFRNYKAKGCPFVLSYTPEMMLSFLKDPVIEKLAHNGFPGKLGTNSTKVHVFNNNNGAFTMANRQKYTGYEVIDKSPIYDHPDIQTLETYRSKWNGCFRVDYDVIVKQLSKEIK